MASAGAHHTPVCKDLQVGLSVARPRLPCEVADSNQVSFGVISCSGSLARCVAYRSKVSYNLAIVLLDLASYVYQVNLYAPNNSLSCYTFRHRYSDSSIDVDSH